MHEKDHLTMFHSLSRWGSTLPGLEFMKEGLIKLVTVAQVYTWEGKNKKVIKLIFLQSRIAFKTISNF